MAGRAAITSRIEQVRRLRGRAGGWKRRAHSTTTTTTTLPPSTILFPPTTNRCASGRGSAKIPCSRQRPTRATTRRVVLVRCVLWGFVPVGLGGAWNRCISFCLHPTPLPHPPIDAQMMREAEEFAGHVRSFEHAVRVYSTEVQGEGGGVRARGRGWGGEGALDSDAAKTLVSDQLCLWSCCKLFRCPLFHQVYAPPPPTHPSKPNHPPGTPTPTRRLPLLPAPPAQHQPAARVAPRPRHRALWAAASRHLTRPREVRTVVCAVGWVGVGWVLGGWVGGFEGGGRGLFAAVELWGHWLWAALPIINQHTHHRLLPTPTHPSPHAAAWGATTMTQCCGCTSRGWRSGWRATSRARWGCGW